MNAVDSGPLADSFGPIASTPATAATDERAPLRSAPAHSNAMSGPRDLRIDHDALGRATRVFIGPNEITHLVKRVNSVHTTGGTQHEVVLFGYAPRARPQPLADQ